MANALSGLWDETDWFPMVAVVGGIIVGILVVVWLGAFGCAVVNRNFATDAYGKCVIACGARGVRFVTPDYKCECVGNGGDVRVLTREQ